MSFEKLSLSVFDFLVYLLPGYLMVFTISIVESNFLTTDLFALSTISANLISFSLLAFFFGEFCHSLASVLKDWKYRWFTDYSNRLSKDVFNHVRIKVMDLYKIPLEERHKLNTLETYQLVDSYILARGGSTEREVLMTREGFFKASMVGFILITLAALAATTRGGITLQTLPGTYSLVPPIPSAIACLILAGFVVICRRGFLYYGRLKMNNAYMLFLSLLEVQE